MYNIDYHSFFPYKEYRQDQEKNIKIIEKSSKEQKNSLLVSPNGTGKTIIALCGLLPLALERDKKIIYMCRTHSQNTRIIKELTKISTFLEKNHSNIKINGISIRGRNEMCLNSIITSSKFSPRESMAVCGDLRKNKNCSFFLNLLKKRDEYDNPILIAPDLFDKPIDAEELIKFCKEKKVCPYFLSKYLLKKMKIIICNYQWIFNPHIREMFIPFIDEELEDCILILDECHNIIDMATEVNSLKISPYSLRLCLRDLELFNAPIMMRRFVEKLLDLFERRKNAISESEKEVNSRKFLLWAYTNLKLPDLKSFENFILDLHEYSVNIYEERLANGEMARDFVGPLAEFWLKWLKCYDLDNYFFCYNLRDKAGKKSISLEIVALDPREIVIPVLRQCYTSVHLSGTVNPYVYNSLMGFNQTGKNYQAMIGASPFKKENIKVIITEGVDTRRENRNPTTYRKMISKIDEVMKSTPKNIGIFCASYKILRELVTYGIDKISYNNDKEIFIEEPGLSASENALMVENFKSLSQGNGNGAILLGVCGGRNSEGEDYPGDYMNSVIIAGYPYHLPSPRVNAKIDYYNKVFNNQGWDFAYLYPAAQRANQASGRPIRKIKDKGAIIFMDSRFRQKYKWISDWIRSEIEIIRDVEGELLNNLTIFWYNSNRRS